MDDDFGMWTPFTCQIPLRKDGRLQLYSETSPRFTRDMDRFETILVRNSLLWAPTKRSDVHVGHVFQQSYFPLRRSENRVYQQLAVSIPIKRTSWYNRLRLEQRFFEHTDTASVRFRHNSRLSRALYRDRVFAFLQNEIFVNLNTINNGPRRGIDQNRILTGIGFRLYKQLRLDIGYQNQWLNRRGQADKMNHILFIGTSQNF